MIRTPFDLFNSTIILLIIQFSGGAQPFRRRVSGLPSNRPLPSFSVVDEDVEVIQYETGKEVDVWGLKNVHCSF